MTLDEVKAKLVNDKEKDRDTLATLIEEASKNPTDKDNMETIKNATMLVYDLMDDSEKQKFNEALQADASNYTKKLEDVSKLVNDGKAEEALKQTTEMIAPYLKDDYPFKENDKEIFVDFSSPIEFYLYNALSNQKKTVKMIPLPQSYLFYLHGFCLIENNKIKEGREILYKGLDISPLNFRIIFEIINSYKIEGNLEAMYQESVNAMPIAHHRYQVAQLYRNVAYYQEATQNYEVAAACLLMARQFAATKIDYEKTVKELEFVGEKLSKDVSKYTFDQTMEILKGANIPLIPSDLIMAAYTKVLEAYRGKQENFNEFALMLEAKCELLATKEEKEEFEKVKEQLKANAKQATETDNQEVAKA